ncbi:MAG: fused MFS/spermidine synthase [Chitinispirillaceae bacterium]|nr:fused MFS/spermidine synthase [Chitinispirillaceae bacterium]
MSQTHSSRLHFLIILLLFFLSGFTALIYQTLWVRVCGQIMGVTVFAVSCVLTVFMAGLAGGSILFGRLIDKQYNGLKLYALLELGIGAYALAFPLLVKGISFLHIGFYQAFHPSFVTLTAIRFLLSFAIMFIPALLMGGTLPALAKASVANLNQAGRDVGSLYSVNSLGAVAGTLLTAFFLIHTLGITLSLSAAAALNGVIALAAFLLSAHYRADECRHDRPEARTPAPVRTISTALLVLVLAVFFMEGLAALALEVVWQRVFVFYFGNSIYSFTVVAATFISGIVIGAFIMSRCIGRVRSTLVLFGVVQTALAFACFGASFVLFRYAPDILMLLVRLNIAGWWGSVIVRIMTAVLIMIVPTILMGVAFPLACALVARNMKLLGTEIGGAYAVNTLGSIVGSFAGGFIFIPLIGIQASAVLLSCLLLVSGAALLLACVGRSLPVRAGLVLLYAGAAVLFSTTRFKASFVDFQKGLFNKVVYYAEGIDGTVIVKDGGFNKREISINGTSLATNLYNHKQLFRMLADLPFLLHDGPKNAVVVGLGGGMTLGTLLQNDSLREVDCVELSSEMKNGTAFFAHENGNALENPKLRLIIEDGKNHMLISDKKYDLITSDPIHPIIAGNSSLYSRNYFALCRERLAPGGVICHWLPFHSIAEEHYKMIISSFIAVFPHASLWYSGDYTVLCATPQRLSIDLAKLKTRLADPTVRAGLQAFGLDHPLVFVNSFVMGEDALREYVKGVPFNDDNRAVIEFLGPRKAAFGSTQAIRAVLDRREPVLPYCTNVSSQDSADFPRYYEARRLSLQGQVLGFERRPKHEQLHAYLQSLDVLPGDKNTLRLVAILHGEAM